MKTAQKKMSEPKKIGFIVATAITSFLLLFIALLSFGREDVKKCTVVIGNKTFNNVELADTAEKLVMGLSGRQAKQTMLFKFPASGYYSFWMKDMLFSLDLVWISDKMKVVNIDRNLAPCANITNCERYNPPEPIMYVLELPAGTAHSLKINQTVQIKY